MVVLSSYISIGKPFPCCQLRIDAFYLSRLDHRAAAQGDLAEIICRSQTCCSILRIYKVHFHAVLDMGLRVVASGLVDLKEIGIVIYEFLEDLVPTVDIQCRGLGL